MSYRNAAMSGVRGRGGGAPLGAIGGPVNMPHQGWNCKKNYEYLILSFWQRTKYKVTMLFTHSGQWW